MAAVAPVRTLWKVHELVAAVACVRTLRGARSSLAAVTMCALEVKSSARGLSKPKRPQMPPQLEQLCIFVRYLASKYQVPKRQQQNNPRGPRNISHANAKLVRGGPHRSLVLACINPTSADSFWRSREDLGSNQNSGLGSYVAGPPTRYYS